MRKHHGEHPRFGATDVCPLVPVSNISMEETVEYARKLAKRIGEELDIAVYCYESAALSEKLTRLARNAKALLVRNQKLHLFPLREQIE